VLISVIALVDFENAFNTISRRAFMEAIVKYFPSLAAWVYYIYGCEALVFSGSAIIHASSGVQQGDPLGPLLFALALQPLLVDLSNMTWGENIEFKPRVVAFHDDLTLYLSSPEHAAKCLRYIKEEGPKYGLFMSKEKTAVWMPADSAVYGGLPPDTIAKFAGLAKVKERGVTGVELLGGSVTRDPEFASSVALSRATKVCNGIKTVLRFFGSDDPQLCLMLLRACLGMVKMVYCLRTTDPQHLTQSSALLHETLYSALRFLHVGDVNNVRFGIFHLHLTSLPIRLGGLGISLPDDLLKFSNLASQLDSQKLQCAIFPHQHYPSSELLALMHIFFDSLTENFQEKFILAHPDCTTLPLQNNQNFLASWYYKGKRERVLNDNYLRRRDYAVFRHRQRVILQSASVSDHPSGPDRSWVSISSDWLSLVPSKHLGQSLKADQFRAALCFRSIVPLFKQAQNCLTCGKWKLDIFGYHALSCLGVGSLTFDRHEIVCKSVLALAQDYGFNPQKNADVRCLSVTKRKGIQQLRPADILLDDHGVQTCVDVTVVSPLSEAQSSTTDGKIVAQYVQKQSCKKDSKHEGPCHNAGGLRFLAFAVDVCGIIAKEAYGLLRVFARRGSEMTRRSYSEIIALCRRKVSYAIQLGVSNQLLISASFPAGRYRDGDAVETSAL